MIEKTKNYLKHPLVKQLRDVRVISLIGFGVIVLLVTWSSADVIQTNYELQKQINRMQEQNDVEQLQNNNQRLRNQYYTTDQYLELQTRKQFGKAAPGETLIIIPKDVAMSKVVPLPENQQKSTTQQPDKPAYQKNFEAWMGFFLHRS